MVALIRYIVMKVMYLLGKHKPTYTKKSLFVLTWVWFLERTTLKKSGNPLFYTLCTLLMVTALPSVIQRKKILELNNLGAFLQ